MADLPCQYNMCNSTGKAAPIVRVPLYREELMNISTWKLMMAWIEQCAVNIIIMYGNLLIANRVFMNPGVKPV